MADLLGPLRKLYIGAPYAQSSEVGLEGNTHTGILEGSNTVLTALRRVDAVIRGVVTRITENNYQAQTSNINEWFNNNASPTIRIIASANGGRTFTLPGDTALTAVFDALTTMGLSVPFRIRIEYDGGTSFNNLQNSLTISPRSGSSQTIVDNTNIRLSKGQGVTFEISRDSGTISNYMIIARDTFLGGTTGNVDGAITLIEPSQSVWDASPTGTLPTSGVVTGNAYKIINAPADQSGRFGKTMRNGDWVVWTAETFTQWNDTDNWLVMTQGDIYEFTQTQINFLNGLTISNVSDRNSVIRGTAWSDDAEVTEVRLKVYETIADYDPTDLNSNGAINTLNISQTQSGYLYIRVPNITDLNIARLTLFAYADTNLLGNLSRNFTFVESFSNEVVYRTTNLLNFTANENVAIYHGTIIDRYTLSNLDAINSILDNDITENKLSPEVRAKLNNAPSSSLPPALSALNNQAEVFNLADTQYTSNNRNVHISKMFAILKNQPTSFPIATGGLVNEITQSSITVTDPTVLGNVQDVTNYSRIDPPRDNRSVMTGAGLFDTSYNLEHEDFNNFRLVVGGWIDLKTHSTDFQPFILATERAVIGNNTFRPLIGVKNNKIVYRQRATTGTTNNVSISHALYTEGDSGTGGLIKATLNSTKLSANFRVYTNQTYLVRVEGYLNNSLTGASSNNYTVTDVDTSQAKTDLTFDIGAGSQAVSVSFTSNKQFYGVSEHIITTEVDNLISGIDELRIDILSSSSTITTSTGNTYNDIEIEGNLPLNSLVRWVCSFRSVSGVENGNLECVFDLYAYDNNGVPTYYQENNLEFNYPALDLNWNKIRINSTNNIQQNHQGFFLNAGTPLMEYPKHSTENNWLMHYDDKTTNLCWNNANFPAQGTEAVLVREPVAFNELLLIDTETNQPRKIQITNGVLNNVAVE